ncbi:MAG: hypothetical protein ACK6AD_06460 [Cyanobacteriota bacterium]|jgi:hypothetical protein
MFFDYIDFDVLLNARVFYRLAGYTVLESDDLSFCKLLVIFRGIPTRIFPEYLGTIHFYDYVCEYDIDIFKYFPNASSIITISMQHSRMASSHGFFVYGYLPVIPSIWNFSFPFIRRSSSSLHISNYKPLANDPYQQQLISLIRAGSVRVYGAKWNRVDIKARPLSYFEANLKLSTAKVCYGLMYPYQRGKSLSGRMWQAPIQGCMVISEEGSNLFLCPGVLEMSTYLDVPPQNSLSPAILAKQASNFWLSQTEDLARNLNLCLNWENLPSEVIYARWLLFSQHCEFFYKTLIANSFLKIRRKLSFLSRTIMNKIYGQ